MGMGRLSDNRYDASFKLLVVLVPLAVLYKTLPAEKNFWGMTLKNFQWRPYCLMLALMVPLIMFASMQPDFKCLSQTKANCFYWAVHRESFVVSALYEICYGIDFIR